MSASRAPAQIKLARPCRVLVCDREGGEL